jgi:hypothetical protein
MVRYVRSDRVLGHDRGRTDNTPVVANAELELGGQGHPYRVHRAFEREREPDRNVGYSRRGRQQCIERDEVHPEYRALELELGRHFRDQQQHVKSVGLGEREELSS